MTMIKNIILLLRPHQWVKNLFVFLPIFFSRHILDIQYVLPCLLVFFAFSLCASSIYCLNDILDIAADRLHDEKKKRPIASGAISVPKGWCLVVLCIMTSFLITFLIDTSNRFPVLSILGIYYLMNIAYCLKLKHVMIVDVFIIAIGFVLRVIIGGLVVDVFISQWILLMTFLLALFLGFAKRRDDVVRYTNSERDNNISVRKSINAYNIEFMNQVIGVISSVTMVCYIMYTVSTEVVERIGSNHLYLTCIFVLAAIIRYLQITIVDVKSGSPTKVLLHDRFLQCCLLGWVTSFLIILYI